MGRSIDPVVREQVLQAYRETGKVSRAAKIAGVSYTTAKRIVSESRVEGELYDERLEDLPDEKVEARGNLDEIFVKILRKVNEALDEGVKPSSWKDLISAVELVVKTRSGMDRDELSPEEEKQIEEFLKKLTT